jgi:hypothetical protein
VVLSFEVLYYGAVPALRVGLPAAAGRAIHVCASVPTNRNKKAACAFTASKEVPREQLQPCVVSIEYHMLVLLLAPAPKLCKPRVLRGERGGRITLSEVEDEIEEGWDGTGREGFDSRHGDSRRSSVRSEWDSSTIANQAILQSDL